MDLEQLIKDALASVEQVEAIRPEDIPRIELYMDQVTRFMEQHLKNATRNPETDKILTKTMINNYAKNDLLPPPVKKKYSREHIIFLIFIYYFKNFMSISDIQTVLSPIAEELFRGASESEGSAKNDDYTLETLYEKVFSGQEEIVIKHLEEDVDEVWKHTCEILSDVPAEYADDARMLGFITNLGFDVFAKKLLIEKLIDSYRQSAQAAAPEKDDVKRKKEKKTTDK